MKIAGTIIDISKRDNWVGVVGTREPTQNEIYATRALVARLVRDGYIVVSGLALGIDTEAHSSALYYNGVTIAIVNTTIEEKIYPAKNKDLAENIKQNGCIIHPFVIRASKETYGFNQFKKRLVERDLILAKLCNRIIAVSDNEIITGGTKWAINYGMKFGKEVYRFSSNNQYTRNPKVENCDIWWKMEFDLEQLA